MIQKLTKKDLAKKIAAEKAASLIKDGSLVGLGTGSTARFFIEALSLRIEEESLKIKACATSKESEAQALAGNIPLIDINSISELDITVDGADEIDYQKRMIKGGGGALLREKIVASISREVIVIVDEDKLVEQLGLFPLPIEVITFAHQITLKKVLSLGFIANFRCKKGEIEQKKDNFFITDNGNYIIDIHFPSGCQSPERVNSDLKAIVGVVETGFFFNMASKVIVGNYSGKVKIIN